MNFNHPDWIAYEDHLRGVGGKPCGVCRSANMLLASRNKGVRLSFLAKEIQRYRCWIGLKLATNLEAAR